MKLNEILYILNIEIMEDFISACIDGNTDAVDRLITNTDHNILNMGLYNASSRGHLSVVERLLQDSRVGPQNDNNLAIVCASEKGHLSIVDRLLKDPRVDPSDKDNEAIHWASLGGHLSVVDRLLKDPRVDPSTLDNLPIRDAFKDGHHEIVNRLLLDFRIDVTKLDIMLTNISMIRSRTTDICFGLQTLNLPALITLTILDALFYNDISMHKKWLLITTIKHFHDK